MIIKLYMLMTLLSGHQVVWSSESFTSVEMCEVQASVLVDQRMSTGLYSKVEAHCSLAGGTEV